ncbi:MAG: ribonuclease, partial [Clostridiales bacterium]|nr:ribonuclease [Clostridiales bacterium]
MKKAIENLKENIPDIEKKINYTFKNKDNLFLALTHSSFANENKSMGMASNERLEFLGDAILEFIVSEKMYLNFAGLSEGEMTKIRAIIVCEQSLMNCSNALELG